MEQSKTLSAKDVLKHKIEAEVAISNSTNNYKEDFAFIGKTILHVRKEKQLTLRELSSKTQISESILSRYEHSSLIPNYQKLKLLATGLEVDFLTFIFKCFNEASITDDRYRITIEEYEPHILELLEKSRNGLLENIKDQGEMLSRM